MVRKFGLIQKLRRAKLLNNSILKALQTFEYHYTVTT